MTISHCPLLGTPDDRETVLAFPSEWNCCYYTHKAVKISPAHQSSYCLGSGHTICPVFSGTATTKRKPARTKKSINAHEENDGLPSYWKQMLAGMIALLFLVIGSSVALWWVYQDGKAYSPVPTSIPATLVQHRPDNTPLVVLPNITRTPFIPDRNTATATALPSKVAATKTLQLTGSKAIKTSKPQQVNTATAYFNPVPTYACIVPNGWVAYIVQSGDTLFSLSVAVRTSVAQLQSANCLGSSTVIYTGKLVYLPSIPIRTPTPPSKSFPTQPGVQPTHVLTMTPSVTPPPTQTSTHTLIPPAVNTVQPTSQQIDPTSPAPESQPTGLPTGASTQVQDTTINP